MPVGVRAARGLHVVAFIALACPAPAQSIDELLQRALSNNRDYLARLQRVREAEALLRQAGVRPAPTLEGEGGSTRLLGAAGSQGSGRPVRVVVSSVPFHPGTRLPRTLWARILADRRYNRKQALLFSEEFSELRQAFSPPRGQKAGS